MFLGSRHKCVMIFNFIKQSALFALHDYIVPKFANVSSP